MKAGENKFSGEQSTKFLKCCVKTLLFCYQCSLVTLAHVHWATNAKQMSGLHVFKLLFADVSACARVYARSIAFETHILLGCR